MSEPSSVKTVQVVVVTPEKAVLDKTAEMVIIPMYDGEFGVLPGRAPVLGAGRAAVLPRAIAYNVVPQVGRFGADGYSGEETKVSAELRKIWSAPGLKVSATAVRVPTIRGHALAAWLTLARPVTLARARALLSRAPGLVLLREGDYPTPRSAGGQGPVFAGRLRRGATSKELALWIVSDNLLKGAALNSVQIAEELRRRGWLKPRERCGARPLKA